MVQAAQIDPQRVERLGPAERAIALITQYIDHIYHGRTGVVTPDASAPGGKRWTPASWKLEGEGADQVKVVYRLDKVGKKTTPVRLGVLNDADRTVRENGRIVAEFRQAGLFPEVVAYIYRQIADVWRADNEFAARWASWAFTQDHRDTKVMLAAFMLVQNRTGAPVREGGEIIMRDDDYRSVGEAMILMRSAKNDFNAKMLARVGDILALEQVSAINRELGFGRAKRGAMGRYNLAVEKWLRHREQNPKLLDGLMRAGFRTTLIDLACRVGYRPMSPAFFRTLRWKQVQSKDGRRTLAIGEHVGGESWAGLTEEQVCERIVATKPNYKVIVGMVPPEIGITRAIMLAAIESGCLSDTDLIIYSPTLEDLGLLTIPQVKDRWERVLRESEAQNRRAANVAEKMKSAENAQKLVESADIATQKALAEVTRDLEIRVIVDKSGSMGLGIERAKSICAKFVQGFPAERLKVSMFNTVGSELVIKHASAAGVEQAFRGHAAGGGTDYASGVKALRHHTIAAGNDVLFIFVGDQEDYGWQRLADALLPLNPVALGMLQIGLKRPEFAVVEKAAAILKIPCIPIEEKLFDDVYATTRVLRNLIANVPVGAPVAGAPVPQRVSLVEQILKTPLLARPVWAVNRREQAAA